MSPQASDSALRRPTAERVAAFIAACDGHIAGDLRVDDYSRMLYSTDASLYQLMPHAVLIPRTVEDVITAASLAAEYGLPVTPRAAGTSLAGQAVNEALVIDFSRHLDGVIEINPEERWARVQPGVVLDKLNATLRSHGLQFGPDPASSDRSTVGGAVANNATGSHSLLYGMTADHVRAMEVVLSDGSAAAFSSTLDGTGGSGIRIAEQVEALLDGLDNRKVIRENTPRYWRRCGGYNLDRLAAERPAGLAQLVCGSEGTLAVMTEITVDLVPRPPHTGLGLMHFDRLETALLAVPAILETNPSAVELLDTLSLSLCRDVPEYARLLASVVDGRPDCLLVVEYQGESEAAVRDGIERLAALLNRRGIGATALTRATEPAAVAAVWRVRKVGLGLLMSMKGDMKPVPFIEDAAVPVEHLYDYVHQIEAYCAGLGTPISYYAHAGAGCLHIRPLINRRSAAEMARMPDIARFAAGLVRGYGGALSSEHGDGRSRSWLNEVFYGPDLTDLFRQVKHIFDPDNRMNPGIIVDPAPMTESMRALPYSVGAPCLDFDDYNQPSPQLRIAYSELHKHIPTNKTDVLQQGHPDPLSAGQGDQPVIPIPLQPANDIDGFVRAVEMCNGCGVCRKDSGTMCPSFMVTREEEHSTRGRANALRAAMAGVLPADELTSPRMAEVMDLCIACKGCKAECPSGVDMARLKTEFLARYYESHGVPLRARFFAHSATLNRLGSGLMAAPVNALLRSRLGRWAGGRMGLAPERVLPPMARIPFETWWRRRGGGLSRTEGARRVVLFIDPFTNYNHPEVGMAAVEFLEAIGVCVVAAPSIDDGRPAISKGLVDMARKTAERTVRALLPAAEAGLPLVGLEPSSLLTLRDEYFHLLPGDTRVEVIADKAITFEEYVAGLADESDLTPHFTTQSRHVLLHGHCHQKALVGTGPAHRILSLPVNYTVEEVDSGCCGMAGAFGYEAEHYDISMRMGERRLLPAVRAAASETIIVTAGMSCRHQIAHGSGRAVLHPAQALQLALRRETDTRDGE
ncbi:MAG: FAD-binding protein [Candidatus Promineofilum sp.]|nr:FAD-binding protein [Promineifilum sp.]